MDNLQSSLVDKEREKKEEEANQRSSVQAMKKQMSDYIKKHAEASMEKDRVNLKLEKETESLKKVETGGRMVVSSDALSGS